MLRNNLSTDLIRGILTRLLPCLAQGKYVTGVDEQSVREHIE